MPRERDAIEQIVRACHSGAAVLCFDYDGTLAPLAPHPALARLTPATRDALAWLACQPGLTVGVVSGRSLEDLRRAIGLAGLAYGGTSGLEVLVGGRRRVAPGARRARRLLAEVARRIGRQVSDLPGVWLEAKPLGLTVH